MKATQTSPDQDFTFDKIHNQPGKQLSLKDFKGKWLILDFWAETCGGCIASMPKMNKLQKIFKNDVQIIMVGIPRKDGKAVVAVYERLRKEMNLDLTVAYDSVLSKKLEVNGMPDIVIIDPDGKIRGRTFQISEEQIKKFIAGETPKLQIVGAANYRTIEKYDRNRAFLIGGNGGNETDYSYRSVLAKWSSSAPTEMTFSKPGKFETLNIGLKYLYMYAYVGKLGWSPNDALYGKFSRAPIIEVKDTLPFDISNEQMNYSYSMCYPAELAGKNYLLEKNERLRSMMKNDLSNYFNYTASIESRIFPCYKLIITNENLAKKLATKGGPPSIVSIGGGRLIQNCPLSSIADFITSKVVGFPYLANPPIFDKTNIKGNIDIKIDALAFEMVKKKLEDYGLKLVESTTEMKVLVIRDKKEI